MLEEVVIGTAEVQQLFTLTLNRKDRKEGMSKLTQVAGLKVSSGEASASASVRIKRGDEAVHEGRVVSLKHLKEEVRKVPRGKECGLVLADFGGCEAGDSLVFFEMVPRKPSLYEGVGAPEEGGGSSRQRSS